MELSGNLWNLVEAYGTFWKFVEIGRILYKLLEKLPY
jgi:hypothetical protein